MIFWKRLVNSCFDIARFRTKYTFNITFRNMFITLPVLTKNMKYNYTVPDTLVQRLMWIWSIFKCFDEYPRDSTRSGERFMKRLVIDFHWQTVTSYWNHCVSLAERKFVGENHWHKTIHETVPMGRVHEASQVLSEFHW